MKKLLTIVMTLTLCISTTVFAAESTKSAPVPTAQTQDGKVYKGSTDVKVTSAPAPTDQISTTAAPDVKAISAPAPTPRTGEIQTIKAPEAKAINTPAKENKKDMIPTYLCIGGAILVLGVVFLTKKKK